MRNEVFVLRAVVSEKTAHTPAAADPAMFLRANEGRVEELIETRV